MNVRVPDDIGRMNMILHLALVVAIPFYLVVAFAVTGAGEREPAMEPQVLRVLTIGLAVLSLTMLGLGWLMPRLLIRQDRLEQLMVAAAERGEEPLRAALLGARPPYIVRLAMLESIAIFGLVLTFLSGDLSSFYPFGVVAVVAMIAARIETDPVLQLYQELAPRHGWPLSTSG